MTPEWPRAWGPHPGAASIRCSPEDFFVQEQLGFELSGAGEHVFLYLQKRELNSLDLLERLSKLSKVAQRDIGYCGLKDRNAVTQQWYSIGLAGQPEPQWKELEEEGDVQVLQVARHTRKLRRGVHKANRFKLQLRNLSGDLEALEARLEQVREHGVPNYFGGQRFGRNGSTLTQARRWMLDEQGAQEKSSRKRSRKITRSKRGLYFSALRSFLFNELLAARVENGDWNKVGQGDVAFLNGTRSFFSCEDVDAQLETRAASGDIHPGLPLWGRGDSPAGPERVAQQTKILSSCRDICDFLEASDLELGWRPTRLLPDDFCWRFCDDDTLQLEFSLGAGSYATALLGELVLFEEGIVNGGSSSE
ncbi:MAG: tRNA pseudouridine13 synthase [Halioglobus sp.]|jgi:tRNA pseudouridine13 synthase